MLHQKKNLLIFVECLPHAKCNSGHFMTSNFLALDQYLRRYSEKTKKKVSCAAPILQVTGNPYPIVY